MLCFFFVPVQAWWACLMLKRKERIYNVLCSFSCKNHIPIVLRSQKKYISYGGFFKNGGTSTSSIDGIWNKPYISNYYRWYPHWWGFPYMSKKRRFHISYKVSIDLYDGFHMVYIYYILMKPLYIICPIYTIYIICSIDFPKDVPHTARSRCSSGHDPPRTPPRPTLRRSSRAADFAKQKRWCRNDKWWRLPEKLVI